MQSTRCLPTPQFSRVSSQSIDIVIHTSHDAYPNFSVTAFTIERYVAICHPFLSHTMSKLSRAIKFIFLIWILSIAFATPQAIQTGIIINENNETWCTIVQERVLIQHSFELATIFFFFAPMTLISVLYMLIGMKLRSSTLIKRENGNVVRNNNNLHCNSTQSNTNQSTKRVLKMLGESEFNLFNFLAFAGLLITDNCVGKCEKIQLEIKVQIIPADGFTCRGTVFIPLTTTCLAKFILRHLSYPGNNKLLMGL
jgi:hypothetical protein